MNLRIITKNHAADSEKRFLAKSISKSNGYATAMPTALKLTYFYLRNIFLLIFKLRKSFSYTANPSKNRVRRSGTQKPPESCRQLFFLVLYELKVQTFILTLLLLFSSTANPFLDEFLSFAQAFLKYSYFSLRKSQK